MGPKNKTSTSSGARLRMLFTAASIFCLTSLSVSQTETWANPVCSEIFNELVIPKIVQAKAGAQFMHERDSKLHITPHVEKIVAQHKRLTAVTLTKPADKINQWLKYLEAMTAKASTSPQVASQLKDILAKQIVMKPSEVPESHYKLQAQIARERGHGDVQFSAKERETMAKTVVQDQRSSLDSWSEYLISKDTAHYPIWLKHWMFTGMTKLSKFDPTTGTFGNRTKETIAPYPELNYEALAQVAGAALKKINKESFEDIQDPKFLAALEGMNFGKLYGLSLQRLGVGVEGQFKTNAGEWIKFPRGNKYKALSDSLNGRNTGWCTAEPSTAKSQLKDGDFYVYYSLDEAGAPTIPRVAIRMQGDNIAEVRGVGFKQNLDEQMGRTSIVTEKMKEFGDRGDKFVRQDASMKAVTALDLKQKNKEEFNVEELSFLYEVEKKIEGFGYQKDPRINEILRQRNPVADLNRIFEGKREFKGRIDLGNLESASGLILPEKFTGDILAPELTTVEGITLPKEMSGKLSLTALISAQDLTVPVFNGGSLILGIRSIKELKFPNSKEFRASITLENVRDASGYKFPEKFTGDIIIWWLTKADKMQLPKEMNGNIMFGFLEAIDNVTWPKVHHGQVKDRTR